MGLARHYENIRYLLTLYLQFDAVETADIGDMVWPEVDDYPCPTVPDGYNNKSWFKLCLNILPQAREVGKLIY